ncbi:MAG: GNAT family N-acetyltransferase [Clostridia bacterium]|nr:GNAT family N-acetyltransferase [Clostridia bacterium]
MNHTGTIVIETQRLILRPLVLKDAQDLYELLIDEQIMEFLAGIPEYTGVDMAVSYINNTLSKKYNSPDFYDWAIEEKESGKMIGRISLHKQDDYRRMADLVWFVSPTVRGKGYATEGARAAIKHLQKVGFERIEAFADVENKPSQRVMEKLGMKYEGTLKKYDCRRDESLYDANMYAITEPLDD